MSNGFGLSRKTIVLVAAVLTLVFVAALAQVAIALPPPTSFTRFKEINFVSDTFFGATRDPNLVNPWGIAINPINGVVWVANNGTGTATTYNGLTGKPLSTIVNIPGPGGVGQGAPTGIVYYGGSGFQVMEGGNSGASKFIFATEDGTILGWNPDVDPTNAIIMVDNSGSNAVYKGLAIFGDRIYVTNFRSGLVETYDRNWKFNGFFPKDVTLPPGYAPFGIQALIGDIFVTYALQDDKKHDDVAGPGHGFVNYYGPGGNFLGRVAAGRELNSPWGLAFTPADYGSFSASLLVGNFGDGHISAYSAPLMFIGQLMDTGGQPIQIPGLWALQFRKQFTGYFGHPGYYNSGIPDNTLYFAAGINHEQDGIFGIFQKFDVTPFPRPPWP